MSHVSIYPSYHITPLRVGNMRGKRRRIWELYGNAKAAAAVKGIFNIHLLLSHSDTVECPER